MGDTTTADSKVGINVIPKKYMCCGADDPDRFYFAYEGFSYARRQ